MYLPFSGWFGSNRTSVWSNHPENSKYNMISSWFNKISKRLLCVYRYPAGGNPVKVNGTACLLGPAKHHYNYSQKLLGARYAFRFIFLLILFYFWVYFTFNFIQLFTLFYFWIYFTFDFILFYFWFYFTLHFILLLTLFYFWF